jgi:hypothetical protein
MTGRRQGEGGNPHPLRASAVACILLLGAEPAAALTSYAVEALDAPGSSTGATAAALGVPDYHFVNDAGLSYGGTNADVFAPGEATVLRFPVPLRNVAGQVDLLVSAFVGGVGATDDAQVNVEVSSNGTSFTERRQLPDPDGTTLRVRPVEAHSTGQTLSDRVRRQRHVTHVRLTNFAGTAEGLRLDAVEGLYPHSGVSHAFELRIDRFRLASTGRFRLRLKNLAASDGVPIRETSSWMGLRARSTRSTTTSRRRPP